MAKETLDLASVLKTAEKKYDINAGKMGDITSECRAISMGNIGLDSLTGIGGLPLGRSVELYGAPSSGKSTTALQTAAVLQKIIKSGGDPERGIAADDKIAYADFEQAIDPTYAISLGFDPNDESCIFFQPDLLEQGTDFIIDLIKTDKVRLVIIDSLASMLPSSIAAESVGKSLPAVAAKLINTFFQKVTPLLAQYNCLLIGLNHSKEKMGMGGGGYGPPQITTPGGMSPKYNASVRMEYKQIKQYKSRMINPLTQETEEVPTSTDVKVKVTKNKVGPPFRSAVVRVRFGKGFDNFAMALTVLIADKQIVWEAGGGGRHKFHKLEELGLAPEWMPRAATGTRQPYVQGKDKIFDVAEEYPEWRDGLIDLARQVVEKNASILEKAPAIPESEILDVESTSSPTAKRASLGD